MGSFKGCLDKSVGGFRDRGVMKLFTSLLAVSLFASPILAQEAVDQKTYVLAKKENPLPVKEKFKSLRHMSMAEGKVKVEVAGQAIEGTVSNSSKEEIIYDFVSEDKIRVSFEKNRSLEKSSMAGQEEDKEEIHPSEGKTVLLEKKEGKWVGKLEKGEIKVEDEEKFDEKVRSLEKEFNVDDDLAMYGAESRKIGESWDVDPSLMPGMEDFDVKGGKLTMTLVEVKEFQGEPCAVLKTSFSIKAEMAEDEMKGVGVSFEGSARIVRSLDLLADYKFTGEMTMDMSGDMEMQPGMNAKMSMKGDMKIDMRMAKEKAKVE